MPRTGTEAPRRAALVDATIAEIGACGSLEVTVGSIARRAGMSTALAHHYFGSKDRILAAALRHLLVELDAAHRAARAGARTPRARLGAVIRACFAPESFRPDAVAAWLAFYVSAQAGGEARRLLRVYRARLRSNLVAALRPLTDRPEDLAETAAALIDGHYIREALRDEPADGARLAARVEAAMDRLLT
ncbi:transcriptional regulator BetI [Jannaschia seohaensis]|uniref:HTH-type transcriptional regulator BetI n=1 Tax=Jannaschia seohaensis TaxID=475081 RepID=A0A2Y9B232_9RHOB|nr:transcriptional regulator BetI [Jannaschia seohaensis]PWJ13248.1 TetR/AcrR family transcriptional repressor of bet genes [Jannaschia seohaensis]SSA50574.1 TetR/AcrR family transcriptional regulator, transcriptional repressor of bet genes [Jannaschia seohaensis]